MPGLIEKVINFYCHERWKNLYEKSENVTKLEI